MNPNSSSYFSVAMSAKAFALVNVPSSAVSILLNIFFVYCMVVPQRGAEQLKNILKVLQGSLVACNITIHSCSILIVLCDFVIRDLTDVFMLYVLLHLIFYVMLYAMMTIVTSCHLKNTFYFCQIVPLQQSFFIWIKKNIRAFVYTALILNATFCLFCLAVDISSAIVVLNFLSGQINSTDEFSAVLNSLQISSNIELVDIFCRLGYMFLSIFVTLVSGSATVHYLWRHMKNVEESGLFSARLQRQMKMTIINITAQLLMNFLFSDGTVITEIVANFSAVFFDWNGYIICTLISLHSFVTTISMAVNQSAFRNGIVLVWQKFSRLLSLNN
ncbi:uncharacterized protein [Hoplias malabaricus]|uniref:uncharacterized protein n=1 Tax=Hoplias malabaricus TaxID=27720 RepID=UPI00346180D3